MIRDTNRAPYFITETKPKPERLLRLSEFLMPGRMP
jgi:hypothetical protein